MSKKYAQEVEFDKEGKMIIPFDWYNHTLPDNMEADEEVYFDTSYSFRSFHSEKLVGLKLGYASGNYGRSIIMSGKNGIIKIGKYVILEATNIICNHLISIGDHCMFSWGSVVTDSWLDLPLFSSKTRKNILKNAAESIHRYMDYNNNQSVVIEDNVWVGFDAVILPGVHLGRGCVIGCKTIIDKDVPPYAVVAGSPSKIIRYLQPSDTDEAKKKAMKDYVKK